MKVAALDLGSNSFLCLIVEVEQGRIGKIYDDQVEIVRLGQGVSETKQFSSEALVRADHCLKKFADLIAIHRPERVLAMATAAAREVKNADQLFALGTKYGIPIEIIPGSEEASITYLGATSSANDVQAIRGVVDIGGGSTEIILGRGAEILWSHSFPLGGVKLTEKFISASPVSSHEHRVLHSHILQTLENYEVDFKKFPLSELVAVAGTPTELARLEVGSFDVQKIDGYSLSVKKLREKLETLGRLNVQERIDQLGVSPGRADVIYAGVMILIEVAELLEVREVKVSTRGVRFGVALELAARS